MVKTTADLESEFIEIPTGAGKHGEPAIRGKGPRIWILAVYAKYYNMTAEQICKMWDGRLTVEGVQAALDFAEKYPELIAYDRYIDQEDE